YGRVVVGVGALVFTSLAICSACLGVTQPEQILHYKPLAQNPANPHYFLFRGKPALLVTSGEHYGAVLNRDFNYSKYLATLAADGMNLTCTFTGAYVEPVGAFKIERNRLAPGTG